MPALGCRVAGLVALASCLAPGLGLETASLSSLKFSVSDSERPVSKVMALLQEMLKQLEKEAREDKEAYEKLECWCEENEKEKEKAMEDGEGKIGDLTTKIEEYTADSARLGSEIKSLQKEVTKNSEALDKATKLREKQLAEFNAEEKDLLESIGALKSAVTVLSKHHESSFLQMPLSHVQGVATTLQHAMQRHANLLHGVLSPSEKRLATSFIQASQNDFDAENVFRQSYTPQSGEIYGILRQMKESFEANLADSQKEENTNQKAYQDLKSAKEAEISAGKAQAEKKTQELAETDEKNAQAKEDIKDTGRSLGKDEEFSKTLKEKCGNSDAEYDERSKTRQQEMEAVSKALSTLSGDDAHDLFSRTFAPSLLQEGASLQGQRERASKALSAAARRLQMPRLALLAYRVRLDAFKRVKKAIADMVAQLNKEKQDEIKQKDFCVEEFNTNKLQTERKETKKEETTSKIEDLEMTLKSLNDDVEKLKGQVREMQVQMKRAGEDRERENREFQMTVADQRETQKLLKAALDVLSDFYKKPSLLERREQARSSYTGLEAYQPNEKSGGVMGMINMIIEDAKKMEAEAIRAEEDSQKAYEDFVKETNASLEAKSKEIVNKSEDSAQTEASLVEVKESKNSIVLELEQLANEKTQLHQSCDFVLKNFNTRQTARDEEIQALKQAEAILSGSKFGQFLQRS